MAYVDFRAKLRALLRDTVSPYAWGDNELDGLIEVAVDDLNAWLDTTYDATNLDPDATTIPIKFQTLVLWAAELAAIIANRARASLKLKFVTQDTTVDPGSAAHALNNHIKDLNEKFMLRLRKWYGIDQATASAIDAQYGVF